MELKLKCPKCSGDLDISSKKKTVCLDCGKEFKKIVLKRQNSMKYCFSCGETVKVFMLGTEGFCPNCADSKIFTIKQSTR